MTDDIETITFTIATDDDEDEITVPADLVELLREDDETPVDVVGDLAMLSFASRAHHLVHHSEGEPDPAIQAIESATMDAFEERFGVTFGEATGHQH